MYIEDDLSTSLIEKKMKEEEEENERISISIRHKGSKSEDEEYYPEIELGMGISSDESRKNRKIIEDAFKNRDSIPVIIHKSKHDTSEILTDTKNDSHITSAPSSPTQNVNSTQSEFLQGSITTESINSTTVDNMKFIQGGDKLQSESTISINATNKSTIGNETEMHLEAELKEAELGLKIPEVPSYSPELLAKLDDEKHMGGESIKRMGEHTGSKDDIQKDEVESSEQMGLVLYTFSDKVTPGLIDYSVITFYVSVVFVAGKLLRSYLWGDTPRIHIQQVPYPDELLIICEGVVISRMRKDIYREEELYMLLIDLIRSPEVLKEITHPLLKTKKE